MSDINDSEGKGLYDDNNPGWKTNLSGDEETSEEGKSASDVKGAEKAQKDSDPASAKELGKAEDAAGAGTPPPAVSPEEAGWYKELDKGMGFAGTAKTIGQSLLSKRGLKGIGIGGGAAGIVISVIMFLLPMKLNMIMENLQDKYFSANENAIENRVEKMFSHYVKKKILPGLVKPGCNNTRTIDKNCVAVSTGDSPFDRLSNAWRDARLENRMAEKYGIELSYEPGSTDFTLRVNDRVSNIDIDGFRKNPDLDLWQASGSRSDIRRSIALSLENETGFKKMYYRYRVGDLLERKYGIRRCFVFCDARDRFADRRQERRNARKLAFIQKVTTQRTALIGEAMGCIIDPACVNSKPDRDGNAPGDFERKDALKKNLNKYLTSRGRQLSSETIEEIAEKVIKIEDAGSLGKYFAGEIAEKIAGTAGKKFALAAIPIIGWIDLAATLIHQTASVGPFIQRTNYELMSNTAVSTFTMYRSFADEQKRGLAHPDVVASMAEGFGDTVGDSDHKGQNAEMHPMYNALFGNQTPTTAFDSLLPTASAAVPMRRYTCEDKTPPPSLACEEEIFTIKNVGTIIGEVFEAPGLAQLKAVAGYWVGIVGAILAPVGDLLVEAARLIPGYSALESQISEWTGELLTSLGQRVFKDAAGDNPSGARGFGLVAAGAEAAAAAAAEFNLGGARISQVESTVLLQEQEAKKAQDFANKPLFARMFDKEDTRSMVGQIAMAMPMGTSNTSHAVASSLTTNPVTTVGSSFTRLFTGRAKASSELPGPFGIIRSGYRSGSPALSVDPETLTKEYCGKFNEEWADDVEVDDATGVEYHTYENPCLLDSAVVSSAGGLFSEEALNDVPPRDEGGESTTPPAAPGTSPGAPVAGDTYSTTTCPTGTDVSTPGGEEGYSGGKAYKIRICKIQGITVNATIAANVDAMLNASKAAGTTLTGGGFRSMLGQINARKKNGCPDIYTAPSSSCRVPTARPGYSNHQMGHAIDFGNCGKSSACFKWLSANAATYGLKNLPSESWHWSVDGR